MKSNLHGEWWNIGLLLLLYTFQGVPPGLAAGFPLILKEYGVSMSQIGTFSLCHVPFSFKLLWAPIVDSKYVEPWGRRKTWIIPLQLLLAVTMYLISSSMEDMIRPQNGEIKIWPLLAIFTLMMFFAATQDIAVDGWGLTLLRKENVVYASTCNAIGQTLGYALSYGGLMSLTWIGISIENYFRFWAVSIFVLTCLVAVVFSERNEALTPEERDLPLAYRRMVDIMKLKRIRELCLLLFCWKIAQQPPGAIAALTIQERGVPKEYFASLSAVSLPISLVIPALATRYISDKNPLHMVLKTIKPYLGLTLVSALIVYLTPSLLAAHHTTILLYLMIFFLGIIQAFFSTIQFTCIMGFFAQISDPVVGGTYMTLLNAMANLSGTSASFFGFQLDDMLTFDTPYVSISGFYLVVLISTLSTLAFLRFQLPKGVEIAYANSQSWVLE